MSHFSAIGFPVTSYDELLNLGNRLLSTGTPISVRGGNYVHCTTSSGAELWLQTNRKNELIGVHPHFAGQSTVRVGLTNSFSRPQSSPLDGSFHGWANPPEDDPTSGDYPFVFDAPNYLTYGRVKIPCEVRAQIAAFAEEISVCNSVEEFNNSRTGNLKFASQAFIPVGLFQAEQSPAVLPEALAFFSGHIKGCTKKINEVTELPFWHFEVDSFGGAFEVVADPSIVEVEPRVGGVLSGTFWLSGRLTEYEQKQAGFFGRIFGR